MNKLLFLVLSLNCMSEGVLYSSLPDHLLPCYRGGGPVLGAPRTLDVFLSLVKKLEFDSVLDIRVFSTSLLRSLRLDGIEAAANAVETELVTPYQASGFQFNKYKLLMDLFLPSLNLLYPDDSLSLVEKCLLHRMLSGTVQLWERGDEDRTCPLTAEQRANLAQNETRVNSRCPIEDGVVKTDWGTISPGTLVAAIAAALEPQQVAVTDILNADVYKADVAEPLMASAKEEYDIDIETLDTVDDGNDQQSDVADIDNLFVATIAGDLAEVVVNQGPRVGAASQRMVVGSNNRWNDTMLPRNYFLYPQNRELIDWHITDSEILAGIDGLILAKYLPNWISQRNTLKLSQIIDMYYSNEGISFDTEVKACNRQTLFRKIVYSSTILTETSRFAHVLYLRQGGVYIPVEKINRISEAAVDAFTKYISTIFEQYPSNCHLGNSVPTVNMIVATDGAWKGYDVEQFISWVGGALHLDLERSTLGLLHGNTGQWIVPPSQNLTSVFSYISNFTDEWPNRMNLPNVISAVIQHSQQQAMLEQARGAGAGAATAVLVASPGDRPSAADVERARQLMDSLRTSHFDVYFAYASQELEPFQNINNEYMDYSEMFLQTESTSVSDVVNAVEMYLVKSEIPTRIIGAQCPFNDTVFNLVPYEDLVTPGRENTYRIHPFYLRQQALINVQFRNDGHGQLLVCMWRGGRGDDTSHSCQTIPERNSHSFNVTTPCPSADFCLPVRFIVTAPTTHNLCANNDCRFPNQVGYYIQHSGLRCLPLQGSAALTVSLHWKLQMLLYFTISLFLL